MATLSQYIYDELLAEAQKCECSGGGGGGTTCNCTESGDTAELLQSITKSSLTTLGPQAEALDMNSQNINNVATLTATAFNFTNLYTDSISARTGNTITINDDLDMNDQTITDVNGLTFNDVQQNKLNFSASSRIFKTSATEDLNFVFNANNADPALAMDNQGVSIGTGRTLETPTLKADSIGTHVGTEIDFTANTDFNNKGITNVASVNIGNTSYGTSGLSIGPTTDLEVAPANEGIFMGFFDTTTHNYPGIELCCDETEGGWIDFTEPGKDYNCRIRGQQTELEMFVNDTFPVMKMEKNKVTIHGALDMNTGVVEGISKLTVDNMVLDGGKIATTTGDLTLEPSGNFDIRLSADEITLGAQSETDVSVVISSADFSNSYGRLEFEVPGNPPARPCRINQQNGGLHLKSVIGGNNEGVFISTKNDGSNNPDDAILQFEVKQAASKFYNNVDLDNNNLSNVGNLDADMMDVDDIRLDGHTISTTTTDTDINITPNGTGKVVVNSDLTTGSNDMTCNVLNATSVNVTNPIDVDYKFNVKNTGDAVFYQILHSDNLVYNGSALQNITQYSLPVYNNGQMIIVKKTTDDGHTLNILPLSGQTINGSTSVSVVLSKKNDSVVFFGTSNDWKTTTLELALAQQDLDMNNHSILNLASFKNSSDEVIMTLGNDLSTTCQGLLKVTNSSNQGGSFIPEAAGLEYKTLSGDHHFTNSNGDALMTMGTESDPNHVSSTDVVMHSAVHFYNAIVQTPRRYAITTGPINIDKYTSLVIYEGNQDKNITAILPERSTVDNGHMISVANYGGNGFWSIYLESQPSDTINRSTTLNYQLGQFRTITLVATDDGWMTMNQYP